MYYNRNRKKPGSFTKTHTQKNKYENLTDSELNTKTREFENTNAYYLSIDKIYEVFLEDFEINNNSFIEVQLDLEKFYKKHLLKDTHEGKALFFIKYPIHDVYFATKKIEEEFFKKLNTSIELFIRKHDLINNLNLTHYNYLFPAGDKDYIKFKSEPLWQVQNSYLMDDVKRFTAEGSYLFDQNISRKVAKGERKIEENIVFIEKEDLKFGKYSDACTLRTDKLFTKVLEEIKKILGKGKFEHGSWIEIPNIPELSYVKWYFKKLIDANEQEMRKIELVLRSRKRQTELADNLYYVYVMSNKAYPNIYKIGWTSSLPEERAEELTGTGHLHPFKVEYSKKFKNAEQIELQCHNYFKKNRVANNREFFEVPLNEIKEYIDGIKW
jgi:hypothetical protein